MRLGAASECEVDSPHFARPEPSYDDFAEKRHFSPPAEHARSYTPGPRTIEVYTVGGFGIDTRVTRETYVEREVFVMGGFSLFGRGRRGL